jgi:hypothetical protein
MQHLLPFVGLLILLASTHSKIPRSIVTTKSLLKPVKLFLTQSELKRARRGFSTGGMRAAFGVFDFRGAQT